MPGQSTDQDGEMPTESICDPAQDGCEGGEQFDLHEDQPGTIPQYNFDNIPQVLKKIPQWVVWKYEHRKEKITKVPYRADDPRVHASSTDPHTWCSFEVARSTFSRGGVDGIGFVFSDDLGIVGIDFDHCIEDGQITPDAWEELKEYSGTYAEQSPSGTGVHVLAYGKIPAGKKHGDREMYSSGRYFTCTGWSIDGFSSEIVECRPAIDAHYEKWFPEKNTEEKQQEKEPGSTPPELSDDEIIEIAYRAENGAKFDALFRGDISGYPSQSEADIALCGILAFYTQDAYQIDSLFRRSALYRPKWDEKHGTQTYGNATIETALRNATGEYNPQGKKTKHTYRELPPLPDEFPRVKLILIVNGLSLEEKSERALRVLIAANNPPRIFIKSGSLCRIMLDEHNNPVTAILRKDDLKHELERVVQFARLNKDNKRGHTPITPPDDVVADILAYPDLAEKFPALDAITECPFILPDGTIVAARGYNEETRTYLLFQGDLPYIPERPTQDDVQRTKEVIEDIFQDFPFDTDASRHNAYAGFFTTVLRPSIRGLTPLFVTDKPVMGSGGSLISKVWGIVGTGRLPYMNPFPKKNDEEMRKVITTRLRGGASFIVFDNIDGDLDQSSLAAVLTTPSWTDRLLGRNEEIKIANRAVWVANGNNIALGEDISRRGVYIRLIPDTPRPWERRCFAHAELEKYVTENRLKILAAIFTITRFWIQQGQPDPDVGIPPKGNYEEWRRMICGILTCAGYTQVLGNSGDMLTATDNEIAEWDAFLETWYHIWGENPVKVADIVERINSERNSTIGSYKDEEKIFDVLPTRLADAYNHGTPERVFGKQFSRQRDRVRASKLRLEKFYVHGGSMKWRVVNTERREMKQDTIQTDS